MNDPASQDSTALTPVRNWLRKPHVNIALFTAFAAATSFAMANDAGYRPTLLSLAIVTLIGCGYSVLLHRLGRAGREPQEFVDSLYICGVYLIAWCFRSWIRGDSAASYIFWVFAFVFLTMVMTAWRMKAAKKRDAVSSDRPKLGLVKQ